MSNGLDAGCRFKLERCGLCGHGASLVLAANTDATTATTTPTTTTPTTTATAITATTVVALGRSAAMQRLGIWFLRSTYIHGKKLKFFAKVVGLIVAG